MIFKFGALVMNKHTRLLGFEWGMMHMHIPSINNNGTAI